MILGMDTSTLRLSLALRREGKIIAAKEVESKARHTESILVNLQALLQQAHAEVSEVSAVAVGLGPGSFTGVRAGIATGLGLSQALGIPITGVSSFLAVAAGSQKNSVLVVEDARQDQYYMAWYRREVGQAWQAICPETLVTMTQLQGWLDQKPNLISGPAAGQVAARLGLGPELLAPESEWWPHAEIIAALAEDAILSPVTGVLVTGGFQPEALQPLYLRKTQAESMQADAGSRL